MPASGARTSVTLDPAIEDRVLKLASARNQSADRLVHDALEHFMRREDGRQRMQQDARIAWESYAADGLHLTAEEADDWLARLEAGDDAEPPACHV
jgi:predicted transcriptional regulator